MKRYLLFLGCVVALGCGDDNPCKGIIRTNTGTCLDGGTGREVRTCVDEKEQIAMCGEAAFSDEATYCTQEANTFSCDPRRSDAGR